MPLKLDIRYGTNLTLFVRGRKRGLASLTAEQNSLAILTSEVLPFCGLEPLRGEGLRENEERVEEV